MENDDAPREDGYESTKTTGPFAEIAGLEGEDITLEEF